MDNHEGLWPRRQSDRMRMHEVTVGGQGGRKCSKVLLISGGVCCFLQKGQLMFTTETIKTISLEWMLMFVLFPLDRSGHSIVVFKNVVIQLTQLFIFDGSSSDVAPLPR